MMNLKGLAPNFGLEETKSIKWGSEEQSLKTNVLAESKLLEQIY
jgi:hypothetical protein